jgi:D-xylose transport system substrate-binding protein
MRRRFLVIAMAGLVLVAGVSACGGGSGRSEDRPTVGVILPASEVSARWQTERQYFEDALRAAQVPYRIDQTSQDRRSLEKLADSMMDDGVAALVVVGSDNDQIRAVLDQAAKRKVATIDYDQLSYGGNATYHVGFDMVATGRIMADGLATCLSGRAKPVVAYLRGPTGDFTSAWLRKGYHEALAPQFASGELAQGPERSVPEWDRGQAATLFEQMLAEGGGKIDAVLAEHDDLAAAAVAVLRQRGLAGKVVVAGRDAAVTGLQNVLSGEQCLTTYRPRQQLAESTVTLAIAATKGEPVETDEAIVDPSNNRVLPAVLLDPELVLKGDLPSVVEKGGAKREDLCVPALAAACAEAGL